MPFIDLIAGELFIQAEVIEGSTYRSQSTDRQLNRIRVKFEAATDREAEAVKDFQGSGKQIEIRNDNEKRKWGIGNSSHSYTVGVRGTRFEWELLEREQLNIEALVLDGWELAPEKYKESFDTDGTMTAQGVIEFNSEEHERFENLPPYVNVVRKGINENPRLMRFGRCLWSEKDGKHRIQLCLVDKSYDDLKKGFVIGEPEGGNVATTAALSALRLKALTELLTSKGIISKDEADAARTVDDKTLRKELRNRQRVNDLDEWLARYENE